MLILFVIHRYSFEWVNSSDLPPAELYARYMQTWDSTLIPLCRESSGSIPELCSDFKPALTNQGMCFTRNGAPTELIYKSSPYLEHFKRIFLSGRENDVVVPNKGSGTRFQFSFVIDGKRVMDLKNGVKWNKTKRATFALAIHSTKDMADIRDTSVKISAGYKTTIRVNGMELFSDHMVKGVDVKKRECKFENENENLRVFKWYSRYVMFTIFYQITSRV